MSIQSALQAGVAGLNVQSRRFATISDNIANSETVGYKQTDVDFISQVVDSGSRTTYSAGGVTTNVVRDIEKAGTVRGSDRSTDLAVNGAGFFLVKGGLPANQAREQTLLTRVGSSYIDKDGYLRLQNGYFLQGVPLDATGAPTSSIPESIVIEQSASAPVPSTSVEFRANLQAPTADTPNPGPFSTDSNYVDELGTNRGLRFTWTYSTTGPGVDATLGTGDDVAGAVPGYWNLTVFDVDTSAVVPVTNGGAVTWDDDDNGGTAATAVAATAGWPIRFDVTGTNAGRPKTGSPLTFTVPGVNGQTLAIDLRLTQFDYSYNPTMATDGVTVSDFAGIEVGEDGRVFSIYENGFRQAQYRLAMGDVINAAGLTPVADNAYAISIESGDLINRFPGEGSVGTVQGFALEGSNVDIAEELTKMITTQRVYSANASTITTADEMLEEVVRLKR